MKLSQAVERFLRHIAQVRRLSAGTQRAYASDLRQFARFVAGRVGDPPVARIDLELLEGYVAACGELAPRTVRRRLSTISSLLGFLRDRGQLDANPADLLCRPREPRTQAVCFTEADLQRLLAAVTDPTQRAMLLTAAAAGLRRSEILGLDVADVDLETGYLRVRAGKGQKDRTVPLTAELRGALREHLPRRGESDSDALFPSSVGTRTSATQLQRLFDRWLADAGLEGKGYTLHSLRHAAATRWMRAGMNLRDVQAMLGHEDVSTTSRYLHASPEHIRSEMIGKVPPVGAGPSPPAPDPGAAGLALTPEMAQGLALLGRLAHVTGLVQPDAVTAVPAEPVMAGHDHGRGEGR